MNIQEIIDYIYKNIAFVDKRSPDLYRKVSLTKSLVLNLCTHPSPYHIPKARRKTLYQLQNLIAARKQELLAGDEGFINEVIVESQINSHKRPHQFNLRKRWLQA